MDLRNRNAILTFLLYMADSSKTNDCLKLQFTSDSVNPVPKMSSTLFTSSGPARSKSATLQSTIPVDKLFPSFGVQVLNEIFHQQTQFLRHICFVAISKCIIIINRQYAKSSPSETEDSFDDINDDIDDKL